jgi:hypothetical protein
MDAGELERKAMMIKMRPAVLLCVVAMVMGCGGGGLTPPQACDALADAFSNAFARCGGDPVATRKTFLDSAAQGTCLNVLNVRDEDALENECLPWFRTASCVDILDPTAASLPDSCRMQLET